MKLLFDLEEQQRIMAAIRPGSITYENFVNRAKAEVMGFIEQAEKTRDESPVWTGITTP